MRTILKNARNTVDIQRHDFLDLAIDACEWGSTHLISLVQAARRDEAIIARVHALEAERALAEVLRATSSASKLVEKSDD
jgi:hypothetical protein